MNKILFIFTLLFLIQPIKAQTLSYDFSDTTSIPIELRILDEISTKQGFNEGQELKFRAIKPVLYNGKIIVEKGEIIKAKAETSISKGMNGFPAEIIVDNFQFENIKDSQLISTYTKTGINRALWVYPIKWALTPIPFVGSLTNLITGGEAKITPKDKVVIQYYPNWK